MIAALFDIEGTLFTNPMGKGLTYYAWSHGRRVPAAAYFLSLITLYQFTKLKVLSRETFNTIAIARMAWLIAGWDGRRADAAFDWVVDGFMLPSPRKPVLEEWERHRRAGHLLLIASGGFTPIVERVGRRLGASGTAGTHPLMENGRYAGRIASPVVIGKEKAARTQRLVAELGADVDWQASSAYADSFHDLPFLELAGHPVAVHPDAGLRRAARERGWPILDGG